MRGKGERRHWACESGFPIPKHTVNTRPKARRQHRSRHRRSSFTNCRRSERHPAPPATPRRKAAQQHPLPGSGETRRGLRGLTLAALVRVRLGPSCYLPRCAAWGTSEWKAREHLGSPRALEPGSSRQGRAAARCASCAIGAGGIAAAARAEARRPCTTGRHLGHPAHLQRVARTERERRGRGLACASPYRPAPLCGRGAEGRKGTGWCPPSSSSPAPPHSAPWAPRPDGHRAPGKAALAPFCGCRRRAGRTKAVINSHLLKRGCSCLERFSCKLCRSAQNFNGCLPTKVCHWKSKTFPSKQGVNVISHHPGNKRLLFCKQFFLGEQRHFCIWLFRFSAVLF